MTAAQSPSFETLGDLQDHISAQLLNAQIEEAHREALLIISLAWNQDIGRLIALSKDPLPSDCPWEKALAWSERRCQHEPMAYICGEREFFGRRFLVGPGALIPRPDTETLIEWVLESHQLKNYTGTGIDLCCGPGTIGITLNQELGLPFALCDLSPQALTWCRRNVDELTSTSEMAPPPSDDLVHRELHIHELDLLNDDLSALPKAELIVCNPPYIPASDHRQLMPDVKDHEPAMALVGGEEGLEFFWTLLERLNSIAKDGCHLYVELGIHQREAVDRVMDQGRYPHWTREAWREDLAGISRVVRFIFSEATHG